VWLLVILRRWEVRTNSLSDECDFDDPMARFFFRKDAEKFCFEMNCWKLAYGYKYFNYYVHDRRAD
jgi:hypothetical protein